MGKHRYPNPYQPTYPAGPSVSAEPGPVCAAAPYPNEASRRWDLRAEKMVLLPVLQPPSKPQPPSQLGRTTTHCKSCGLKLPPQRLSSTAAPPGLPAAGDRGKGGTNCQRLPDPKGPRRPLLIPGFTVSFLPLTLIHHPVARSFIQSPPTAFRSALHVW